MDKDGLVEVLTHANLSDMPDVGGTNSDHDTRYFTETECDGRFLKLDGSNANTNIDIGVYHLTATRLNSDDWYNNASTKKIFGFNNTVDTIETTWSFSLGEAVNFGLGSAVGTRFGTASDEKLAFYGSVPIIQPTSTTDIKDALVNLGLLATGGATPLNLDGGTFTTTSTGTFGSTNTVILGGATYGIDVSTTAGSPYGVYVTDDGGGIAALVYNTPQMGYFLNGVYTCTLANSGGGAGGTSAIYGSDGTAFFHACDSTYSGRFTGRDVAILADNLKLVLGGAGVADSYLQFGGANLEYYSSGIHDFTGGITTNATIQAEHLYSTDDAVIDDDLTVSGLYNIVATTATEGQIVQGGTRIFHTFTPSQQAPTYPNVFIGENAGSFTMDNTGGAYQGTGNVGIGEDALTALTTGYYNFVFGSGAGKSITEGHSNFIAGHAAGDKITTGDYNILFGRSAGLSLTTQNRNVGIGTEVIDSMTGGGDNTVIGHGAGNTATSMTSNVLLGFYAGHYQAGTSNYKLIIDGIARADAATELTDSLIYGVFNSAVDSQSITFNVGTASFGAGNITTTGLGTLGSLVVDSPTLNVNVAGYTDRVGIGTATPQNTLTVRGASVALTSWQTLSLISTTAQGAGNGCGIMFGGRYVTSSENVAGFGSMACRKENSTSGNVAGYFEFGTRVAGGSVRAVMTLDSLGNMLMNIGGNITTAGRFVGGSATITASSDTTDVSGINTLFINPGAAVVIGGFVGGVAGQVLFVSAIANGQDITLEHVEGIGGATQDVYLHSGLDETLSTEYGGWTLTCNGTNWYDTSHAKHV